ncbi:hypothetical protein KI387_002629, partial [Taxus chinensis]
GRGKGSTQDRPGAQRAPIHQGRFPTQNPPHPEIVPQAVKETVEIDTLHTLQGLSATLVRHMRDISEPDARG